MFQKIFADVVLKVAGFTNSLRFKYSFIEQGRVQLTALPRVALYDGAFFRWHTASPRIESTQVFDTDIVCLSDSLEVLSDNLFLDRYRESQDIPSVLVPQETAYVLMFTRHYLSLKRRFSGRQAFLEKGSVLYSAINIPGALPKHTTEMSDNVPQSIWYRLFKKMYLFLEKRKLLAQLAKLPQE